MGILQQIRSDANFLRNLIDTLRSDCTTVTSNGIRLTGEALEKALAAARAGNRAELKKLDLILESGIIPEKYYSIITKQTYYPSTEELRQKSEALPPAKHSFFCVKSSRKITGLPYSSYKVVSDNGSSILNFFMEHKDDKSYPRGGFGKIKKGSLESSVFEPKLAIKIYHKDMFSGNTIHELRLAMRAAYCSKQFGRQGYAFRRNSKQYMVTEWLQGVNLDIADQQQIQSMPIPQRIVMAISLLRELSILHKQGLIHNDIKPSNVLVNYGKLNFVDLDSIRPKNEMPLVGSTPMYSERFLPTPQMSFDVAHNSSDLYLKFDEKTDIYAMGITLAHLFQDIYIPKEDDREIKVTGGPPHTHTFRTYSLFRGPKYNEHPELQKLLKNMVFQELEELSSVDDYIDALKKILLTYPNYERYLNEDKLAGLGAELTKEDGEKAFKDIEIELLGYNQRVEAINTLKF